MCYNPICIQLNTVRNCKFYGSKVMTTQAELDAILGEHHRNPSADAKLDLSGQDLRYLSFQHYDLIGVDFSGCRLSGANFSRLLILRCNFNGSQLCGANFSKARIRKTDFIKASLQYSYLIDTSCQDSDFSNADMLGILLYKSNLFNCHFENTRLKDASLAEADIVFCSLSNTNLDNIQGYESRWDKTVINKCNFNFADLICADMRNAVIDNTTTFQSAKLNQEPKG